MAEISVADLQGGAFNHSATSPDRRRSFAPSGRRRDSRPGQGLQGAGAVGLEPYLIDLGSLRTGPREFRGGRFDWATVKLTEAVPDVNPYSIPSSEEPPPLFKGQLILQVSHKHSNFKIGDTHPKTIEECHIRDLGLHTFEPVQTDCNTGGWSSGSAQFVNEQSTGKVVIGALNTSEHAHNIPGTGYDSDHFFNSSVELRGDFLKAVRENLK